ncbi:methyltransferase domain-containing protein [Xanthomonas translucens]|uniref:SAM-dependent methyltransferase n=3 Tax=Xanthomonas campestris pv. translucens TaxID=343 RepID=A0A109HN25_XANCT|nr:class I SAM-dependent methyltransferase [Xanthomonas translucens]AVY68056.1 SAM-dependent methyltransferase [Xanthomonas translucens pv. undulosa]ELQ16587.1 SAM-binding motif-containing protein [Xanthomonas translucens DAR61454]KTF39393.1 SAM-dependent methyltransferase [Xanthomonas translucens pv. translucens]KWV14598.1 SAM-dependent methyltransferase [Xanthomonas translucens]KWV15224.1 SAM-dependent methyltransferase [Xanthomonas translucens]
MHNDTTELLADVAGYYSDKLAQHGQTARGVDWNGEDGQALRFAQLCTLIGGDGAFSVNDLGCGYAALYDYLRARHAGVDYAGFDVSADMVAAAATRHAAQPNARFVVAAEPDRIADYGMASGIFNVRLGHDPARWQSYVEATLDMLDRTSRTGFAFNCLTSYSDRERMRDHLYYADPCQSFDLCKRRYSRNVALLHDYSLYEFTILVRKTP